MSSETFIQRGTIVGRYRVEGILGRGGMAVVYRATHLDVDRQVALKVLAAELSSSPEFVERFRREGRLQWGFRVGRSSNPRTKGEQP